MDPWFNHTLYVICFTDLISGSFGNGKVNISRQYVLPILLCLLWDHAVPNQWKKHDVSDNSLTLLGAQFLLDQWFKQTLCSSCFTSLILGAFDYVPVKQSKHYVLAISLCLLWVSSVKIMNKIRHYMWANSLTSIAVYLVLDQWFNLTIYVRYFI